MSKNNNTIAKALLLVLGLSIVAPSGASYASEKQPPVANQDANANQVEAAEKTVEDLKDEVQAAEETLAKKEEALQEAKATKDAADQRVEKAVDDLNQKSADKDKAGADLKKAEEADKESSENLVEVEAAKAKKEKAETKVKEAEQELAEAKTEQASAEEAVKNAKQEVENANNSVERYRDALDEAEVQLQRIKDENEVDKTAEAYYKEKGNVDKAEGDVKDAINQSNPLTDDDKEYLEEDKAAIAEAENTAAEKEILYQDILKTINDIPSEIEKINQEKAPIQAEFDNLAKKLSDRDYVKNDPAGWRRDKNRKDELEKQLREKDEAITQAQQKLNQAKADEYQAYSDLLDANKGLEDAKRENNFQQFLDKETEVTKDILLDKITAENYDDVLAQLNAKISEADNRAVSAEEKITSLREKISDEQDKIQDVYNYMYGESFQAMLRADEKNKNNYYETKEALERMQNQIKESEEKITSLRNQLENTFIEYDNAKDEESQLLDRIAALENLKADNNDSAEEAVAAVKNQYESLKNLIDSYNALGKNLELLKDDYEFAKQDLEETSTIVGENRIKLENAEKNLADKKAEEKQARADKESADQAVVDANNRLEGAKKSVPTNPTDEEIEAAKVSEEQAKSELAEAKKKSNEAKEAYDKALKEVNDALKAQNDAQAALDQAQADRDAAEAEKDAAEKALADKEKEVLSDESKEIFEKAKQSLKDRLDASKEGADEKLRDAIIDIEGKLDNENLTVVDLLDLNSKFDNELKDAQKRQNQLVQDKNDLQKLVDQAQANLDSTDVSSNGEDLDGTKKWVSPKTRDDFKEAIDKVNSVLADPNASAVDIQNAKVELDKQIYYFDNLKFDPVELTITYDTTTRELEFTIEEVPDETLELGKRVVLREGEEGEITDIHKITYRGKTFVDAEVISSEVTKYPKNTIVRVGFKLPDYKVEDIVVTEDIPFTVDIVNDDKLEEGAEKVVQEGELGVKTIKKKVLFVDGVVEEERIISEEITKQPVNKIVRRGTKPVTPEQTVGYQISRAPIEFIEEEIPDETLEAGKKVTLREGENGLKTYTHKVVKEGDKIISSEIVKEEITLAPKNKIIRVGTKALDESPQVTTETTTTTEKIPFIVEKRNDPTLEEGREIVEQEGENGLRTFTHTFTFKNGKLVDKKTTSEVTKEAKNRIVRVGTKITEYKPINPKVDNDYKKMFLDNMISLSKLTDAEKAEFAKKMDNAKSNGEIYDIYNEAVDLNKSRKANSDEEKPSSSLEAYKNDAKETVDKLYTLTAADKDYYNKLIDQADNINAIDAVLARARKLENQRSQSATTLDASYLQEFLANILKLSNLTYEEKVDFASRINTAKTNGEVYEIYNEAVNINTDRANKKPVDPSTPTKLDPAAPTEERGNLGETPFLVITNPSYQKESSVSGIEDIVFVPAGYTYFNEGFYTRSELLKNYKLLKEAYDKNLIQVRACKMLLEKYPKTVASIKVDLLALIQDGEDLQKEAVLVLNELEEILGLSKTIS